jgi:cytoskeleton protein RodZ
LSTTIGQQLRQAREARSLSLEQVAQATHIRMHYLQAMEAGDFSVVPSMAQARGFLRAYAGFLNLDADALLKALADQDTRPRTVTNSAALPPATLSTPEITVSGLAGDWEAARPIFTDIGRQLFRQRELLGLSLDDVERHTHLRQHYLQALESGDLSGLPSPVQGRGMLNNYASFLGLDPEPLLLHFAEGLQTRLAARQAVYQESHPTPAHPEPTKPSRLRRLFSGDVLVSGVLAILLVAFMTWGAIRIFAMRSEQKPTPTSRSISDVLLASPTFTATFTPLPPTPTIPTPLFPSPQAPNTETAGGEPLPLESPGKVQVYVTVLQRSWMRVTVDSKVEFEGRVIPGSAYPFVGESQIEILTGNGAGLSIIFNQQDLGPLGVFGQVVNRIFTIQGIITPTPTITLTPTATLPATRTPLPTATPQPGEVTQPALP